MKLAEALLHRADLQKRIAALQVRVVANAIYQEGETPAEDSMELLEECLSTQDRLEELVVSINVTNVSATLADGRSVTAALATRETLRGQHSILVRAADAASGDRGHRQMRSELRQLSALPVKELRTRADEVAMRLRALDAQIQQANWEVELL